MKRISNYCKESSPVRRIFSPPRPSKFCVGSNLNRILLVILYKFEGFSILRFDRIWKGFQITSNCRCFSYHKYSISSRTNKKLYSSAFPQNSTKIYSHFPKFSTKISILFKLNFWFVKVWLKGPQKQKREELLQTLTAFVVLFSIVKCKSMLSLLMLLFILTIHSI